MVPGPPESAASRPPINATGFIGYAIDLIELRPEEEHLREWLLGTYVYRDLTVWSSLADVQHAMQTRQYGVGEARPFFCVVDDDRPHVAIMDDDQPTLLNATSSAASFRDGLTAPWHLFRASYQDLDANRMLARAEARQRMFEALLADCVEDLL